MPFLTRTFAVVGLVVACLLGIGTAAGAQTAQSTQRSVGGPRGAVNTAPTPPPLPMGDATESFRRANVPASSATVDALSWLRRMPAATRRQSPVSAYRGPHPQMPKLSQMLNHSYRQLKAASGASIVLTGPLGLAFLEDQTMPYGATVGWVCYNLQPNTNYEYVVFSPDGYAAIVWPYDAQSNTNIQQFKTDGTGRCLSTGGGGYPFYAFIPLQTPVTSGPGGGGGGNPDPVTQLVGTRGAGTDAPYSGVWAIAAKNMTTGNFDAVAYTVVLGTLNFNTYSDAGYSVVSSDFASGATVYVSASGLNPAHAYAYGFVKTADNALPCVYTIPSASQNYNNATCFIHGSSGVVPTLQTFQGQFPSPSSGANSTGTYSVELYDTTTNDLISTQQMSLNGSAGATWGALVPYNSGLGNGTMPADNTIAVDGILNTSSSSAPVQEESVTGLSYVVNGLNNAHTYRLTIHNPNGVVMSSSTNDPYAQQFSPLATYTPAGGTITINQLPFPYNATSITSLGQVQIPFAPNVYTAQLYDTTTNAVVASKSFRMVSYSAAMTWTAPTPGNSITAPGGFTNATAQITNNAGTLYGSWNADSINKITIQNDNNNFTLLNVQTATTTDSNGKTWNITVNGGQTLLTITPAVGGTTLTPGATMNIPLQVRDPAQSCSAGCVMRTSIYPVHGIAPSVINNQMQNTAVNGILVYKNGGAGNGLPTYGLTVGAYSAAATLPTPRYNQMMYRQGTNGASGGSYTMTFTVNNSGSGTAIDAIEWAMPSTYSAQLTPPTLVSAIVNGTNRTANWTVQTPNPGGTIGSGCNPAYNDFGLTTNRTAAAIGLNQTAVFTLSMPILPTSFPFQQIPATTFYGSGTPCDPAGIGGVSSAVGSYGTPTNAIAGTTNIDSTELGLFSLDDTKITASLSQSVIPALATASTTFKLQNTSTGQDPNPDYISQLLLTVPAGAIPNSITVTSPNQGAVTWNANPTGTAGQWLIDLCAVATVPNPVTQTSTPCTAAQDANSLPPGDELDVTFHYTAAPTVGTYPIAYTIVGANGKAVIQATAAEKPVLTVANTTAQTSFTYAGGYTSTPSYPPAAPIQSVPSNAQPTVGSWADFNNGNGFVYELYNNGSTAITNVDLAIPSSNLSGQLSDTQTWNMVASSIHVYGAGAAGAKCSGNGYNSLVEPVAGSPGTQGLLTLSGCNIAVGQKLDIFFYATSPYDANDGNPNFAFNASVGNGAAPGDPRTASNINTFAIYSNANVMHITSDARLVIEIPTGGGVYNPALYGGGAPTVACPLCSYSIAGPLPLITLSGFTGTQTAGDVLAASVYSDDTNGWNLSVSADINPSTATGQVSTWVDPTHSTTGVAGYTQSVTASPGTVIPTSGTLPLSAFTGTVRHQPVDNVMSYQIAVGANVLSASQTTTVTLTYTLVAN